MLFYGASRPSEAQEAQEDGRRHSGGKPTAAAVTAVPRRELPMRLVHLDGQLQVTMFFIGSPQLSETYVVFLLEGGPPLQTSKTSRFIPGPPRGPPRWNPNRSPLVERWNGATSLGGSGGGRPPRGDKNNVRFGQL